MEFKNKSFNPIKWLKHKGWFLIDLPFFIKANGFKKGVELGAKAGRSMFFMLKFNKQLHLIGIDQWQVIEGTAYRKNPLNEEKCRGRLNQFNERVTLIKEDALLATNFIDDNTLDFVHYDLQCKSMKDKHEEMIKAWMPKIKDGGMLIGRDFRDFREAFYNLGYREREILRCKIKGRFSQRLEYLVIKG